MRHSRFTDHDSTILFSPGRPWLEFCIRRRVLARDNVMAYPGCISMTWSLRGDRVTVVRERYQDSDQHRLPSADLSVDIDGPGSLCRVSGTSWLPACG